MKSTTLEIHIHLPIYNSKLSGDHAVAFPFTLGAEYNLLVVTISSLQIFNRKNLNGINIPSMLVKILAEITRVVWSSTT